MKLRWPQWLWMAAVTVFMTALLADVAGLFDISVFVIIASASLLLVIGWRVMPSLADLSRMSRSQPAKLDGTRP